MLQNVSKFCKNAPKFVQIMQTIPKFVQIMQTIPKYQQII